MKSSVIAQYLGKELQGTDIEIKYFSSLSNIEANTLVFAKKYSSLNIDTLNSKPSCLAIVGEEYYGKLQCTYIVSNNPRLDYLKILSEFFVTPEISLGVHERAYVEKGAVIGEGSSIGANVYIGSKVTIGDNCIIMPNTSIYGKVIIGNDCYIESGVVIGGEGFGYEYDDKIPVHFPHTGSIIIGNNVYIGANSTVAKATIDSTIIEDNVKIDSLVLVAHNCKIGKNTLIAGGATLGGGVTIGENAWIAPNSSTYQQIHIGSNSKVGIGAIVLRNVKEGITVFGNPAMKMKL